MWRMKTGLALLGILASVLFVPACAMVTRERTQGIPVTSFPARAVVSVNGQKQGLTPIILNLGRKEKGQVIRIESPGYDPLEIRLMKKPSGAAFFGNFLNGLLLGIVPASLYSLGHDGRGFLSICLLSGAAFGALLTALDSASGALNDFVPKEITVTLKKTKGPPQVDTMFLGADEFKNIKWIRVRRN